MTDGEDRLARMRALADEVVDRTGVVHASHGQRLADEGSHGPVDPARRPGPVASSRPAMRRTLVERLASI